MDKIRLGISACLLGEQVRFDGSHRLDRFLRDTLGRYIDYVPVCPEVECGLGIPREYMHLEGKPEAPRLITTKTRKDLTDRMVTWARQKVKELEHENLCGFIFKSDSPSSGMERVRIYGPSGMPQKNGVGIFAGIFMKQFPMFPTEEEGRLHDPILRENFIESIFVFKRWRELPESERQPKHLIRFHTEHKYLIMSHSPRHLSPMGKLTAEAGHTPADRLYSDYQKNLLEALRLKTTVKKNVNVLMHMMGYFKKQLTADEKRELLEIIDAYHQEHVPLVVPITLINHYVRKYEEAYLKDQFYLNPHPLELQLRNHA